MKVRHKWSKMICSCAGLILCTGIFLFPLTKAAAQSDKIPGISLGSFKVNNVRPT